MENSRKDSFKLSLSKLNQIKSILLISIGIFILRYLILIISTIWSDIFVIQDIPVLFICQIVLALVAFTMFCYELLRIKDYCVKKKHKRIMNSVVITLIAMIVLLIVILFTWSMLSFIPASPSFPYELWIELIVISMPFAELIPLTIAMLFLSYNFWMLRKADGWRTNALITPLFFLPLTIIRILAAVFKVINILNPLMYPYAWNMADYSRIISAALGIILFIEILINIWRLKPKIIIQQIKNSQ